MGNMLNYKPIDRAAFVLFKKDSFSYDTFFPDTIPHYVTLFETRFLLTDWEEFILGFALRNTSRIFQKQLSIILQKEFRT
jgi:hypothetical protein